MEDAVVSALVIEVLGRLTSVAVKEFDLLWGFKDDVLSLKKDFEDIRAVLQDAEIKRIMENTVELWLKRLKYVSLEVKNVLDEISTEAMLQTLYKKRGTKYRVRAFFSPNHNRFMFRVRLAHKVKALRTKVETLAPSRFELRLTNVAAQSNTNDAGVEGAMSDRETSSKINSSTIFGRVEETEMVVEKICNKDIGKDEDDDTIRVFGMWGMGGTGKTTLAQLVYNHDTVKEYFELRFWVYVSEKFQDTDIIKKIITLIDDCQCNLTDLEMLEKSLQSKLSRKKFLVVLDDVWIENAQQPEWNRLSKTLSCGSEESIVVMTTRSVTTSLMMAKVPALQHNVGGLSKDDSWSLFEKLAFARGRQGDSKTQLEPIGRQIVDKCKGLPLALNILGNLMWSKWRTRDWQDVRDNYIWEMEENNILPSLKLSYDHLLPHLRRCFAYCCVFPKGYEMEKDEIIQLWVANDFIPPRGETSLYLLGEEIFNCLVRRSFFQVGKGKLNRDRRIVHGYKMHDLMHDMARYVMKDDILVVEPDKEVVIREEVLHVSLSYPDFLFSPTFIKRLTSLRSIFVFGYMTENHIRQIVPHVNLRVLYLRGTGIKTLPGTGIRTLPELIYKLKHLKYLNLSGCDIEVLPESIVYLQNLQVLILSCCWCLSELPKGLGYMTNLECLEINGCDSLLHLPLGIKKRLSFEYFHDFLLVITVGPKWVN